MEQILFAAFVVASASWFLWRRRIDPIAIGFASCVIYFLPGFVGWVGIPAANGATTGSSVLSSTTYAIMSLAIGATVVASALPLPAGKGWSPRQLRFLPETLFAITAIAAALSIASIGAYYLCQKSEMLKHIGGWYYLSAYTLPLCLVVATIDRRYLIVGLTIPLLLADLYIGFRANVAIVAWALLMLRGEDLFKGWKPALRLIGIGAAIAAVLLLFPAVAYTLKYLVGGYCPLTPELLTTPATAEFSAIGQLQNLLRHLSSSTFYVNILSRSEPFVIQTVLNEVVISDFRTDATHILNQLLTGVPGGKSLLGIDSAAVSFNSQFQPTLFPEVNYGMANSPWAQAYSAGGIALVVIFAGAFGTVLWLLSAAFYQTSGSVRGIVAVVSAWLAFYSQRNDLLTQIGIMKQVIYTSVTACVLATMAWLVWRWLHRRKRELASR